MKEQSVSIPFSVYDFFAYLSSGAVIIATADYVLNLGILRQKDVGPVWGVALIILAYVTGQIVSQFSATLLEHTLAKRILQRPSILLLGGQPRNKVLKWIFPNYHRALPANVQERVREQAAARNCSAKGEGLFLHVYPLVTKDEHLQARLDQFRNQYSFARNMSFAFMVSTTSILISHWRGPHPIRLRWAALAAFAATSLLYRYLKFLHQYSYELFLRYSEL
jgi:hypothetical protein